MEKRKRDMTSASVGYAGNVEIKLLRGDKVIRTIKVHNKGKAGLFTFLANCLIGNYEYNNAPKFIMLGYTSGTDAEATPVSTNAIPYSGVSMEYQEGEGEGLARAIFKFLIPFSTIPNGEEINCIRLYASNIEWDSHIAYFILNPDETITSDGRSNILITWTMTVSNQIKV